MPETTKISLTPKGIGACCKLFEPPGPMHANPYEPDSPEYLEWQDGFDNTEAKER